MQCLRTRLQFIWMRIIRQFRANTGRLYVRLASRCGFAYDILSGGSQHVILYNKRYATAGMFHVGSQAPDMENDVSVYSILRTAR